MQKKHNCKPFPMSTLEDVFFVFLFAKLFEIRKKNTDRLPQGLSERGAL